MNAPGSLKTMLRCRDFAAARHFYVDALGLAVVEEWENSDHPKHRPAFDEAVANDKIELQIHVESVDGWVDRLRAVAEVEGPVTRPWGNRYLWVRDPDGVRVALFQGPNE